MIRSDRLAKRWPVKPLGEVVDFLDHLRKPITASERETGPYPYYGANGEQDRVAGYLFDEPLVLLAEDGGYFGDPNRSIAYSIGGKTWVNNHAHVLRPKPLLDLRFLCRHLERYDVTPFVNGTTRQKLTKGSAERIPLSIPPLSEQRRIADILDETDSLRQKRSESVSLANDLVPSIFSEMFGDVNKNDRGWETSPLHKVAQLDRGRSRHRPRNAPELYDGPYPFVQTGDIANSGGWIESYSQTYSTVGLAQSRMWPKGTLCITIAANIAATAILTFDACFPDSVVGLVPGDRLTTNYVRQWFVLKQSWLEEKAPQAAQKNINLEILNGLEIPVPPKPLLLEYEQHIAEWRKVRKQQAESQCELNALFHSLLQRAFRGEL